MLGDENEIMPVMPMLRDVIAKLDIEILILFVGFHFGAEHLLNFVDDDKRIAR
jgi:hypothetical protein